MHLHDMQYRKCDKHGCGHFDAPRGERSHSGVDLACRDGQRVYSPVTGKVTKVGWPYADDYSYRYVQITAGSYDYRIFYVSPYVSEGDEVLFGDVIGRQQELNSRYSDITEHIHFEIKNLDGDFVDPTPLLGALKSAAGGVPAKAV